MRNQAALNHQTGIMERILGYGTSFPRKTAVGLILLVALLAFETFNFDTTRYALRDLLGDIRFANIEWAAILAIAFCSIDFAGLTRIFTKEKGADEPKEVWYLMGAWLLGASMNAIMTWWAVSLTLLENEFGNEVMSREQLLRVVPIFVAVLVWLTRILFIGSFTVAGEHFFEFSGLRRSAPPQRAVPYREPATTTMEPMPQPQPQAKPPVTRQNTNASPRRITPAPKPKPKTQSTAVSPTTPTNDLPNFLGNYEREVVYEDIEYTSSQPVNRPTQPATPQNQPAANTTTTPHPRPVAKRRPAAPTQPRPSRIKQRPPMPNSPRRQ
ncbi:MAG: hypothetical protein H6658_13130 [Ardenticatenaceae bacterium]|nr:hypothetical protein [Ardenticatenaceae bacterium]